MRQIFATTILVATASAVSVDVHKARQNAAFAAPEDADYDLDANYDLGYY